MVFQSYALYPHMSVAQNMAFALKIGGVDRARRSTAARGEGPSACSNWNRSSIASRASYRAGSGSASRWAAPSCASRQVFLFDEPLSNLDAKLRVHDARSRSQRLHARLVDHEPLRHARPGRGDDARRSALIVMNRRAASSRSARRWRSTSARRRCSSRASSARRRVESARKAAHPWTVPVFESVWATGRSCLSRACQEHGPREIKRARVGSVGIRPEHMTPGAAGGIAHVIA